MQYHDRNGFIRWAVTFLMMLSIVGGGSRVVVDEAIAHEGHSHGHIGSPSQSDAQPLQQEAPPHDTDAQPTRPSNSLPPSSDNSVLTTEKMQAKLPSSSMFPVEGMGEIAFVLMIAMPFLLGLVRRELQNQ